MNPFLGHWIVSVHVIDRVLGVMRPRQMLLLIRPAFTISCNAILGSPGYLRAIGQCLRERRDFDRGKRLPMAPTDSYLDWHCDQAGLRRRACPERQDQEKANEYAFGRLQISKKNDERALHILFTPFLKTESFPAARPRRNISLTNQGSLLTEGGNHPDLECFDHPPRPRCSGSVVFGAVRSSYRLPTSSSR